MFAESEERRSASCQRLHIIRHEEVSKRDRAFSRSIRRNRHFNRYACVTRWC